MTKIKLCGLSRLGDVQAANRLQPEYVGFVFAPQSKRRVTIEQAKELKKRLDPRIRAVGVFVCESPETVARLLEDGVIDLAQLHGKEDEEYVCRLRNLTRKPLLQAFRITCENDIRNAETSRADFVLLDSGAGTGRTFDWSLLQAVNRPYFLAGGLDTKNVTAAIETLAPYAVDVSSGIETDGKKDEEKMAAFVAAVRKEEKR